MNLNRVFLAGHLGQDPEIKETATGKKRCSFSVATNRHWRDPDGNKTDATTWHNIVAWDRPAEIIAANFHKGSTIFIEGRIDNRSYSTTEGAKRYVSEVVVDRFEFIDKKGGRPDNGDGQGGDDLPF